VARASGTCTRCGVETMVVTAHAMGEPLSIVFCPHCGDRRWASAMEPLHLDEVIARFRQAARH
jgi:transcription elongation factor Elf1